MSEDALTLWACRIAKAAGLAASHRVLDVGGSPGALAAAIRDASGAEVCVSDPRPAPLAPASVSATAEALPFADGCFDCLLFSHVLHHLPDPAAVLHEAARVLAPGGALVVRFASHDDLRADPRACWMPRMLEGALTAIPDTPAITAWVAGAGLRVVSVETVETPACGSLEEFAEAVAVQAAREWAMRGDASPDPRPEARRWAMESFPAPPAVRESLLLARKPPGVA